MLEGASYRSCRTSAILAERRLKPVEFLETSILGVMQIQPVRFADARGSFAETYSRRKFAAAGIAVDFVQDNHSVSEARYTLRGLHFQAAPQAQAKLVSVLQGRMLDVVVDLRRQSPSFGRHLALELSAQSGRQLYIPKGCAHGYCTLEPACHVLYKVSSYYAPDHERGILWHDPALAIPWPCQRDEAIVVARDRNWPCLSHLPSVDFF